MTSSAPPKTGTADAPATRGSLLRILAVVRPHLAGQRLLVVGGLAALLAEVAFRVFEPWPVKVLIDAITVALGADLGGSGPTASPLLLIACGTAVVALATGRALANYLSTVAFALVGSRVATAVRADVHRHAQALSVRYHRRSSRGDLVQRLVSDVGRLQEVATTAGLPLLGNVITLVVMTVVMALIDPLLTVAVIGAAGAFGIASRVVAPRVRIAARHARDSEGSLAGTASENFGAIAVVQAFGLESLFGRRFASSNQRSLRSGVRSRRLAAGLERSTDVVVGVATGVVLALGGWQVIRGRLTPGDLVLFLTYLKTALKPLRDMAKYTGRLARAAASGDRILDVLNTAPEITDVPGAHPVPARAGHLMVHQVSLSYDRVPVLKGLSVSIPAGQRVAVVGPSGVGKSTLVSLLLRQCDPDRGVVLLDGVDLRDYRRDALRASIAVVLQDAVLLRGSIAENIRMGRLDATDEQVRQAAAAVGADDFVVGLPDGYHTEVGERGDTLSGGQRQRIALARAVLRDAPVLILDEPTTGLDDAAAAEVRAGIRRVARGRTTLVITHDLDTALDCDRVLWLAGGVVAENGTVPDLVARGGAFARWCAGQRALTSSGSR